MKLLTQLACRDLWHDRRMAFCIGTALMAVVGPLLLLAGLKHGVVSAMQNDLLQDPYAREIRMVSSGHYGPDWIATLQQQSGVAFAIGLTRSLNTQVDLASPSRQLLENVESLPTDVGDPLLKADLLPLSYGEAALSASAAERLGVGVGDDVRLAVTRRLDTVLERGTLLLRVVGVLEAARFPRPAVFIPPDLLLDIERFRDGAKVISLGLTTGDDTMTRAPSFARARMYAAMLEDVQPITTWLRAQKIETQSRAREIDNVRAINHLLGTIFGFIAVIAVVGCTASLVAALTANVDRKRRDFAVLRLIGFESPAIAGYVTAQASMLAIIGFGGGLAMYLVASHLLNTLLAKGATTSAFRAHLDPSHVIGALLITLTMSVLISWLAAHRATRVQPAESLREV